MMVSGAVLAITSFGVIIQGHFLVSIDSSSEM